MNILFRCDGSIKIGMGHVIRCLALADHLKENHGCKIHFAMRKSELGINRVKKSYPVIEANEQSFDYVDWFFDCISQTQSKILIMDMRDGLTKEQLKLIKKKTGIKVVTIDDPEDKRLEADLAFYPPVPQLEKLNWDGFEGELYVGWEYVLLRKEFLKQYPKPKNSIPNILVSMGATDGKNMTEFVINSLDRIIEKFKVTIIVGSGYPYLKNLKKTLEEVHFEFELLQNPKDIAKIMSQSDFSIISFGQTAYELAALKVPTIFLCLSHDHNESSKLFINEEIGVSMGEYSKLSKQKFIKSVQFHLKEQNKVKEMSNLAGLLTISDLNKISLLILG